MLIFYPPKMSVSRKALTIAPIWLKIVEHGLTECGYDFLGFQDPGLATTGLRSVDVNGKCQFFLVKTAVSVKP